MVMMSVILCCVLIILQIVLRIVWCILFFFKQKTAYEMRISDWSSDVCSSDLARAGTGDHCDLAEQSCHANLPAISRDCSGPGRVAHPRATMVLHFLIRGAVASAGAHDRQDANLRRNAMADQPKPTERELSVEAETLPHQPDRTSGGWGKRMT